MQQNNHQATSDKDSDRFLQSESSNNLEHNNQLLQSIAHIIYDLVICDTEEIAAVDMQKMLEFYKNQIVSFNKSAYKIGLSPQLVKSARCLLCQAIDLTIESSALFKDRTPQWEEGYFSSRNCTPEDAISLYKVIYYASEKMDENKDYIEFCYVVLKIMHSHQVSQTKAKTYVVLKNLQKKLNYQSVCYDKVESGFNYNDESYETYRLCQRKKKRLMVLLVSLPVVVYLFGEINLSVGLHEWTAAKQHHVTLQEAVAAKHSVKALHKKNVTVTDVPAKQSLPIANTPSDKMVNQQVALSKQRSLTTDKVVHSKVTTVSKHKVIPVQTETASPQSVNKNDLVKHHRPHTVSQPVPNFLRRWGHAVFAALTPSAAVPSLNSASVIMPSKLTQKHTSANNLAKHEVTKSPVKASKSNSPALLSKSSTAKKSHVVIAASASDLKSEQPSVATDHQKPHQVQTSSIHHGEGRAAPNHSKKMPHTNKTWVIKVGTFKNMYNAQRLERKLKRSGFPAYQRTYINRSHHRFTEIVIGPIETMEEAHSMHHNLRSEYKINGVINSVKSKPLRGSQSHEGSSSKHVRGVTS